MSEIIVESAKFLKELQDEALKSILNLMPIENNIALCAAWYQQSPLQMGWCIKFTLNGVEHSKFFSTPLKYKEREKYAEEICEWLASLFFRDVLMALNNPEINC